MSFVLPGIAMGYWPSAPGKTGDGVLKLISPAGGNANSDAIAFFQPSCRPVYHTIWPSTATIVLLAM
jgi:hypothetical protein